MNARPGRRATLFLVGLSFLPEHGGGFLPPAFVYNAGVGRYTSIQTTVGDSLYCPSLRCPPAQNWQLPGTQPRQHRLRRSLALAAAGNIRSSVARTPMPPGYEGGKQQRKEDGDDSEFNLNVGKVIDTLRSDYPRMFEEPIDFEIYTDDLQLRDPVRSCSRCHVRASNLHQVQQCFPHTTAVIFHLHIAWNIRVRVCFTRNCCIRYDIKVSKINP